MTTSGYESRLTDVLTPASVWQGVAGEPIHDGVLEWPPDLFALTDVILERSEAYRFALSPPPGEDWPPRRGVRWSLGVTEAARQWSAWAEDGAGSFPEIVEREWAVVRDGEDTPLEHLREGQNWRLCEALLTLHAIADEACAGLGVALTASVGIGSVYRARGRELLARTGTLARIPSHLLRVLPKVRTTASSSASRSLCRYACVNSPGVDVRWHKVPGRRPGTEPHALGVNFLLLPWPLRVRESDFRPLERSVRDLTGEPFGFFEFVPSEGLDLDLVDRMLVAGRDEVDVVNVVVLPESAVDESDLDQLEALLARHGVTALITGVRERPTRPDQLPGNSVHIGVLSGDHWVHIRQQKHHRWSLDEGQIYQYHLGGALHPHIRWWEAMEVPRRAVQFVEVGEGVVLAALVCEDLAQIDSVADMLRSVGPTMVVTPLLDGPQLSSRWSARYASVLADDPGSAVLTLTSSGMARRSRPRGRDASPAIALWKDPVRGSREIALEAGAQGVLVTASADITTRRSGDGRDIVNNCTQIFDVGVYQVQAASEGSNFASPGAAVPTGTALTAEELTVLTSWAEAVAETLAAVPEHVDAVLTDSRPGASWRTELGLAEPSTRLSEAIDSMSRSVPAAMAGTAGASVDEVLASTRVPRPGEGELDRLARAVLQSAIEQRQLRRARQREAR